MSLDCISILPHPQGVIKDIFEKKFVTGPASQDGRLEIHAADGRRKYPA
jgi:hypothetical protein